MRKKASIRVVAELLPVAPRTPKTNLDALERLVAEKVHEILAEQKDNIMQPFFTSRRVSDELRRLQTVPERRKFAIYFERWGCLSCRTKRAIHAGNGMCQRCYNRETFRLRAIVTEQMRESVRPRFDGDLEALAKRALLKALPGAQKDGKS